MERLPELIIVDSARSHGFTDGQITHAFVNAFRAFEEDDLVMVIGAADGSGVTLVEVGHVEPTTAGRSSSTQCRPDPST